MIPVFTSPDLGHSNVVDLRLSGSDAKSMNDKIKEFKQLGFIKDELNPWRKGKIVENRKLIKIKFKFHGTSPSPLYKNAFSFKFKHKKKGPY